MEHKLKAVWDRKYPQGYGSLLVMECTCGHKTEPTTGGSMPARLWAEHLELWA